MFVKENVYRLLGMLFVAIILGGIILTTMFFKNKITIATNPDSSALNYAGDKFDFTSYEKVIKRLNIK